MEKNHNLKQSCPSVKSKFSVLRFLLRLCHKLSTAYGVSLLYIPRKEGSKRGPGHTFSSTSQFRNATLSIAKISSHSSYQIAVRCCDTKTVRTNFRDLILKNVGFNVFTLKGVFIPRKEYLTIHDYPLVCNF